MKKSIALAVTLAAKSKRLTAGQWLEALIVQALPPAFRKGLK